MNHPLILTMETLPTIIGLSKSTIEQEIRADRFPKPRLLSGRRTGWLYREVLAWVESRPLSDLPPPPNTSEGGRRHANSSRQLNVQNALRDE